MAGQIEVRRRKSPYTNIQNKLIWDENLRPQTRWILIAMLSLPDDWDYSIRGLAARTKLSKDTIARMLIELEAAGYLKRRQQSHGSQGRFDRTEYILTDVPYEFDDLAPAEEEDLLQVPEESEDPAPCPNLPDTVAPYTVNSPQQNNIYTNTPYRPPQGTVPQGVPMGKKEPDVDLFERFWAAYPRKKNKARAHRAWNKLNPDLELCRVMAAVLERDKRSRQWNKDGGDYIPHASTWLNNRPWEDGEDTLPSAPDTGQPLRGEGVRYL